MGKGKLLFKGDKPKKKKSKSKHSSSSSSKEKESAPALAESQPSSTPATASSPPAVAAAAATASAASSSSSVSPSIRKGSGKITTSGTVVTGHDGTKFEKELMNGDALMCIINGREELRVITMRLSNVSLNLSSPFTQNISTPSTFHYIKQPRDKNKERKLAQKRELETASERQQHAYDLYQSDSLVYREKTETGSYRIKKESISSGGGGSTTSRGQLLELRTKKASDKYC